MRRTGGWPPTRGRLAVVTASPDELHALGARMLADLLERGGWEVIALGAAAPADALADLVATECPDVVALSTSTVGRLPGAEEAVAMLGDLRPRPLIVVGGALYSGPVAELARTWGADVVTSDLALAVDELRRPLSARERGVGSAAMRLLPQEQDRLLLFLAAELARARRARGLKLNQAEATAIVADGICELARDGLRYDAVVAGAYAILGEEDVLDGVRALVRRIEVEAVFRDGRHLVVVEDPLGAAPVAEPGDGEPEIPWLDGATARIDGRQRGRGPHRRHQPPALLRDQPHAALRPRGGVGDAPRRPGRARSSSSRPASRARSR